jgi:hypothetical protein
MPGVDEPQSASLPHETKASMTESRFRAVKAYKNESFLLSSEARILRILSEYVEPQTRFEELRVKDTIVFFGSARIPSREVALVGLEEAKRAKPASSAPRCV